MRFVYLGYDFMLPIAEQLVQNGHQLEGIMSFPCDQIFNFNHNCQALAKHTGAGYIESTVTQIHIESFLAKGVKAFISAGYPYKIPPIDAEQAYGINIHPSYLPYARGAMPVPHIIINEDEKAAGYTIHKLESEFDTGDILFQEQISLETDESVERYCAKILTQAPAQIVKILNEIEDSWTNAAPQDNSLATSYKLPDSETRTLNWSQNIEQILRTHKAFGRYGCHAKFADRLWNVYACDGWTEQHDHESGTCIALQNNLAIIAAENGYMALKEFEEIQQNQAQKLA